MTSRTPSGDPDGLLPDAVARRLTASRYNVRTRSADGQLLLYNAMSGGVLSISEAQSDQFLQALAPAGPESAGPVKALYDAGMLVADGTDEIDMASHQHEVRWKSRKVSSLILMPHENCNFRCTYCYESFERNKMEPWVRNALKIWAYDRCRDGRHLTVAWFGGEPLLAPDVIAELSESFMASCAKFGVRYSAGITTNGYLLTPDLFHQLLSYDVRSYQITLDGPGESHDRTRKLAGGAGTYDRIYQNLRYMHETDARFDVIIRMNFDQENMRLVEPFLQELKRDFGGDARFRLHFHPVEDWSGSSGELRPICNSQEINQRTFEYFHMAADAGFGTILSDLMKPQGSVCYAANPNNFVVGANGTVYKCTVALTNPRNQVGSMQPDGRMELDADLMDLWCSSDAAQDNVCQSCFYRPSCQGAACPLIRIELGERPCPPIKGHVKDAMKTVTLSQTRMEERRVAP